jgi:hypothetical protein
MIRIESPRVFVGDDSHAVALQNIASELHERVMSWQECRKVSLAIDDQLSLDGVYMKLFMHYNIPKDDAAGSIECEKKKNVLPVAFRAAFTKDMRSGAYIQPSFTKALQLLHEFSVSPKSKNFRLVY